MIPATVSRTRSAGAGLSWWRLRELEREHGDAFYVLDTTAFQQNYWDFLSAFRSIYPRTEIAYSYKTNYVPRLCRLVDDLGGYAEVVSSLEYDLARTVGVIPSRIIFNGPCKTESDVARALIDGAILNVDSLCEVRLVERIAASMPGREFTVGVRCNLGPAAGRSSRFGLDIENGDFAAALSLLMQCGNCRVAGLHCHLSTPDKGAAAYEYRTRRLLELAQSMAPGLEYIDVGGGFFSPMRPELRAQFTMDVPSYGEYARAIATPMAETYREARGPILILEPGTALIANVMDFVAKVVAIKRVGDSCLAFVSGSIYDIKPTLHKKNLPVRAYCCPGRPEAVGEPPIDIVGYTCMEHDHLYHGYGECLAEGDYVVFESVGAYALVLNPPFIRPVPAVIAFNPTSGAHEVVKREETFADVFSRFVF